MHYVGIHLIEETSCFVENQGIICIYTYNFVKSKYEIIFLNHCEFIITPLSLSPSSKMYTFLRVEVTFTWLHSPLFQAKTHQNLDLFSKIIKD